MCNRVYLSKARFVELSGGNVMHIGENDPVINVTVEPFVFMARWGCSLCLLACYLLC